MVTMFPDYVDEQTAKPYIIALLYRAKAIQLQMECNLVTFHEDDEQEQRAKFAQLSKLLKATYLRIGAYSMQYSITDTTLESLEAMVNAEMPFNKYESEDF